MSIGPHEMLDRWMYGDGANDVHHDVFGLSSHCILHFWFMALSTNSQTSLLQVGCLISQAGGVEVHQHIVVFLWYPLKTDDILSIIIIVMMMKCMKNH